MDWGRYSTDDLEQRLLDNSEERSRSHAVDLGILGELDRRQIAMGDGCRNLSEWAAARLDVGLDTARKMIAVMRRTSDRPDLREALAAGVSFDRVEALSRIPEDVGLLEGLDVAGVKGEAARRVRITAEDEYRSAADRFLVLQPSLDESWWKIWGGLDGLSGALVDKVLAEGADRLPVLPDGTRGESSWRRATALVGVCTTDDPPPASVTVFVDAVDAAPSNGEAGVVLESGPRVGAEALEAILCDATTEIIARTEDGRIMEYGRRMRTVPPALRRAVFHRDGGTCAADGCDSRYRLEAHHIVPWSKGGRTDPDNLIALCWFHHHVVIHERGFQLFRHPQHGQIRFRKPDRPAMQHGSVIETPG